MIVCRLFALPFPSGFFFFFQIGNISILKQAICSAHVSPSRILKVIYSLKKLHFLFLFEVILPVKTHFLF